MKRNLVQTPRRADSDQQWIRDDTDCLNTALFQELGTRVSVADTYKSASLARAGTAAQREAARSSDYGP